MPRSVIVLSSDANLFDHVRDVLGSDPRFIVTPDNVHCDGSAAPLTNIYPVTTDPADWIDWDAGTSGAPDPQASSLLIFESRSPEWVAEVGRLLTHGLSEPLWFVDSADAAWPADRVDSERVVLA